MLDPASPHGLVAGHGGSGPGFSIGVFHFPALAGRPVTIVVLANWRGGAGQNIAFAVADALADRWN
jgi:hypothetical protein